MRRIPGIPIYCGVCLLLTGPAVAVSPSAKTFIIEGAPPMQTLGVEALAPRKTQARQFRGTAALHLSDGTTIPLGVRLEHKRKTDKGLYRLASTATTLPKFRGTILTQGEPESVKRVRLVLTRGRRDTVKQTSASNVTLVPMSTVPGSTTTSTTSSPTGRTTSTTLVSGCFQDWGDGTIRDVCTGLQWEKKETSEGSGANPSNLHDVDNRYTWFGSCRGSGHPCQPNTAAAATCAANGGGTCDRCTAEPCDVDRQLGAITTIWDWLSQLNAARLAGHADWRIPMEGGANDPPTGPTELSTILARSWCQGRDAPCIDPIFGPTADGYWSSSINTETGSVWIVFFRSSGGYVNDFPASLVSHLRAVRASP